MRRLFGLIGAVLMMATANAAAPDAYEARTVSVREDGRDVAWRYRLMRPAAVDPQATYPLVLFLHGAGERGSDNAKQLAYLPTWLAEPALRREHPCFVLAPQCREGRRWADYDWSDKTSSPQQPEPTADLAAAVAALDAVIQAERVDPDGVSLTGLSMGGYGAWDLAARMPERFAAVIPICGGGDEATAGKLAKLPIWCFHGADDDVVPVARSRSMVAAVQAAGGRVTYTELAGVRHDSWTPAYRDPATVAWLFRQRRGR